ncbi:hypothetical protein M231_00896 [Tremella mesenterica]|uniref:Uncharacterized protein n=1 Tax=Tremella mesenterica TaxID=5217 RepID=A0A4V1M4X6_TREME|nr:hypothetical protein M231_00896 [Tremella mesenterica]
MIHQYLPLPASLPRNIEVRQNTRHTTHNTSTETRHKVIPSKSNTETRHKVVPTKPETTGERVKFKPPIPRFDETKEKYILRTTSLNNMDLSLPLHSDFSSLNDENSSFDLVRLSGLKSGSSKVGDKPDKGPGVMGEEGKLKRLSLIKRPISLSLSDHPIIREGENKENSHVPITQTLLHHSPSGENDGEGENVMNGMEGKSLISPPGGDKGMSQVSSSSEYRHTGISEEDEMGISKGRGKGKMDDDGDIKELDLRREGLFNIPSTPKTPKSAHRKGIKSSISYSPAAKLQFERIQENEDIRGQTLTDKHADLLRLIANKERRISELRQELIMQETALEGLKKKWTLIATKAQHSNSIKSTSSSGLSFLNPGPSTSKISPTFTIPGSSDTKISPTFLSPVSSTTRLSFTSLTPRTSVEDNPQRDSQLHLSSRARVEGKTARSGMRDKSIDLGSDDRRKSGDGIQDEIEEMGKTENEETDQSYFALLQAQTNTLLSPETIREGKKFLGQLVKTVSAAAGGTVPEDEGTLDLSALGLGKLLPSWTLSPPITAGPSRPHNPPSDVVRLKTEKIPPPPSNRKRLPSDESLSGTPSDTQSG